MEDIRLNKNDISIMIRDYTKKACEYISMSSENKFGNDVQQREAWQKLLNEKNKIIELSLKGNKVKENMKNNETGLLQTF